MKNILLNIKKNFVLKEYIHLCIILSLIIIIRIFIVTPYRIPSGSMQPTILVGDFILVNRFLYGINLPIIKKKIKINNPERGDIIVFRSIYEKNYIKRVIGLPGDSIKYINKRLYINKKLIKNKIKYEKTKINKYFVIIQKQFRKEYLNPKKEHYIQIYKNIKNINYNFANVKVPDNSYFVLGDNRDNSEDSRFWGFVKEKDLLGKAFLIWLSVDYKSFDIRWNRIFKKLK